MPYTTTRVDSEILIPLRLIEFTGYIKRSLGDRNYVLGVFIDVTKAFGTDNY